MQQQGSSGSVRRARRSTRRNQPEPHKGPTHGECPNRANTTKQGFSGAKQVWRKGTKSLDLVLSTVLTHRHTRNVHGPVLRCRVEASRGSGAPQGSKRVAWKRADGSWNGGRKPRQRCQGWSQIGRTGSGLAYLRSSRWTELCRVPTTARRTVQQFHLKKRLSALQACATMGCPEGRVNRIP
jgi:hypothetical protein